MVDQGAKGYCVVASTERVMRYYGADVDANELAQMAKSDAEAGTSYGAMIAALKKVAGRLKVRVREVEKLDAKDVLGLIRDYNRVAKKEGASAIPEPLPSHPVPVPTRTGIRSMPAVPNAIPITPTGA